MINYFYVFLLAIWCTVLFVGEKLGLSVILFIIPLLLTIYIALKKNNKIKNKKGLLLLIPILLISATYFLFDNLFFKILNSFALIFLIILLLIMIIRPTFRLIDIIADNVGILLNPIEYMGNVLSEVTQKITSKLKLKEKTKKKIISACIILPIVIIILFLLSSADMVFNALINNILKIPMDLIENISIKNLILKIIVTIIFFLYLSATLYYLLTNYIHESRETEIKKKKKDTNTIKALLITLNIMYAIFDIIQIKSLLFHSVGETVSYAEYARQGFFQLMIVSLINLCVILYTKRYDNKQDNNKIKILSIILVGLTFIIIISSFIRMYLYEQEFGYTLLRLLVYISLLAETVCLIPTIMYIIKDKFNIAKSYIVILITIYVLMNYMNIDKIIAMRNIARYDKKEDIDIHYLMNNHADNIPELTKFLHKVKDKDIKIELKNYLNKTNFKTKNFKDWNLSKKKAEKYLK